MTGEYKVVIDCVDPLWYRGGSTCLRDEKCTLYVAHSNLARQQDIETFMSNSLGWMNTNNEDHLLVFSKRNGSVHCSLQSKQIIDYKDWDTMEHRILREHAIHASSKLVHVPYQKAVDYLKGKMYSLRKLEEFPFKDAKIDDKSTVSITRYGLKFKITLEQDPSQSVIV